jgi:hypothetical protein
MTIPDNTEASGSAEKDKKTVARGGFSFLVSSF